MQLFSAPLAHAPIFEDLGQIGQCNRCFAADEPPIAVLQAVSGCQEGSQRAQVNLMPQTWQRIICHL